MTLVIINILILLSMSPILNKSLSSLYLHVRVRNYVPPQVSNRSRRTSTYMNIILLRKRKYLEANTCILINLKNNYMYYQFFNWGKMNFDWNTLENRSEYNQESLKMVSKHQSILIYRYFSSMPQPHLYCAAVLTWLECRLDKYIKLKIKSLINATFFTIFLWYTFTIQWKIGL